MKIQCTLTNDEVAPRLEIWSSKSFMGTRCVGLVTYCINWMCSKVNDKTTDLWNPLGCCHALIEVGVCFLELITCCHALIEVGVCFFEFITWYLEWPIGGNSYWRFYDYQLYPSFENSSIYSNPREIRVFTMQVPGLHHGFLW